MIHIINTQKFIAPIHLEFLLIFVMGKFGAIIKQNDNFFISFVIHDSYRLLKAFYEEYKIV